MDITFEDFELNQMANAARDIAAGNGYDVRPHLPADARGVWDDGDLDLQDWHDAEACALGALWSICEVLRAYESWDWGNTGGRYAHSGGFLGYEDWEALEAEDYEYEGRDMVDGDWEIMVGVVRQLDRHDNLRGVIQMADILSMALDVVRVNN